MKIKKEQLEKFVKVRNASAFSSNLQFGIDAKECGFSVDDLPKAEKHEEDGFTGWRWVFPELDLMMIELGRGIGLRSLHGSEPADRTERK